MTPTPAFLTSLYTFNPSRRIFALGEVQRRALDESLLEIADHAGRGIAHDRQLMHQRNLRATGSPDTLYGPEAPALDVLVDNGVVGLHGDLDAQARMFLGEPRGEAAITVRDAVFPDGPGAITQLPYAQEHVEVDAMLARFSNPDLAIHMAMLPHLPPLIERVRTLNVQYGAALHDHEPLLSTEELQEADVQGQNLLSEVVAMILAHYARVSPANPKGRAHLLEPIMRQNDAIRLSRRRRRNPSEIDPDTGEEIPAPAPGEGSPEPVRTDVKLVGPSARSV